MLTKIHQWKKSIAVWRGERGQSFMEFAISLVFLLTLLAAAADLGSALFTMIALRDAAQEASVFGSICPDRVDLIQERLIGSTDAPIAIDTIDPDDIEVCIVDPTVDPNACGAPISLGNSIKVTVTIQHKIVTPFVGAVIGTQEYPLTVTVLNTILRTKCY